MDKREGSTREGDLTRYGDVASDDDIPSYKSGQDGGGASHREKRFREDERGNGDTQSREGHKKTLEHDNRDIPPQSKKLKSESPAYERFNASPPRNSIDNTNLFINFLPFDFTDDKLMELFSKIGRVKSAKVMVDLKTGKSKGFGFVKFEDSRDAAQAILKLNGHKVMHKTIIVKYADREPQHQQKDSNYRPPRDSKAPTFPSFSHTAPPHNSRPTGFSSAPSIPNRTQSPVEQMQNVSTRGSSQYSERPLTSQATANSSPKGSYESLSTNAANSNVYIKGLPTYLSDSQLLEVFQVYGKILDYKIMKDKVSGENTGIGFVKFDSAKAAENAIFALNGYTFAGENHSIVVKFAESQPDNRNKFKYDRRDSPRSSNDNFHPFQKEFRSRDSARDTPRDVPRDTVRDTPRDVPRDIVRDSARDTVRDPVREPDRYKEFGQYEPEFDRNREREQMNFAPDTGRELDRDRARDRERDYLAASRARDHDVDRERYDVDRERYDVDRDRYDVDRDRMRERDARERDRFRERDLRDRYALDQQEYSRGRTERDMAPDLERDAFRDRADRLFREPEYPKYLSSSGYSPSRNTSPLSPGLSKLDFPPVGEGELIISGLPSNTEDVDLYRLFAPQGAILDASVAKDSLGKCKGYGYIKMANYYAALNCIHLLDGSKFDGRPLQVTWKR